MKNPECLAIDLDIYNVYLIFDSKYMYRIYIGMPITFIQLTCCINHHCVSQSFFTELSFMFSIFCAITVPFLLICIVLFMGFFFAAITFFFHQYFIHIFHQNKTAVYLFPVFPFNNTIHFIVALIYRCFSQTFSILSCKIYQGYICCHQAMNHVLKTIFLTF